MQHIFQDTIWLTCFTEADIVRSQANTELQQNKSQQQQQRKQNEQ